MTGILDLTRGDGVFADNTALDSASGFFVPVPGSAAAVSGV